jgi:hypothetical protein
MKKYIIVGSVSIIFAIILIIQLYENADIPFVDEMVEAVASKTGLGKDMVQHKTEQKKIEADKKSEAEKPSEKTPEDQIVKLPNYDSIRRVDSLLQIKKLAEEKRKKPLFNSQVDSTVLKAINRRNDSLARVAAEPPKKKKKLFNSASEETPGLVKESEKPVMKFFTAKIKDNQKFNHNDEVMFRLADNLTINGKTIPANTVFTAKANVFEDRIHFILKKIEAVPIKAENYTTGDEQGIPIKPELRLKNDYLLSAGTVIKFGYLN